MEHLESLFRPTDMHRGSDGLGVAFAVDSEEEGTASALYMELYLDAIGEHDGSHIEGMRGDGAYLHHWAMGVDDGSIDTEGVGGGAGGGGDELAVAIGIGNQFAIDIGGDRNHTGGITLHHCHLVECEGAEGLPSLLVRHEALQQVALLREGGARL